MKTPVILSIDHLKTDALSIISTLYELKRLKLGFPLEE